MNVARASSDFVILFFPDPLKGIKVSAQAPIKKIYSLCGIFFLTHSSGISDAGVSGSDGGVVSTFHHRKAIEKPIKIIRRTELHRFSAIRRLMGMDILMESFIAPMMRAAMRKRIPPIIPPRSIAAVILSHAGFAMFSSMNSHYITFVFSNWHRGRRICDPPPFRRRQSIPPQRVRIDLIRNDRHFHPVLPRIIWTSIRCAY